VPVERPWWDDDEEEDWPPRHPKLVKVTAVVVCLSLVLAGLGTLFEVVFSAH
jgi:hypothetical protein